MNSTSNYIIAILALIGATAGIWGAYTVHTAMGPPQSIEKHLALQASFNKQIESAQKRGDTDEVSRLRSNYESYEEGWRESIKIGTLVEVAYQSNPEDIDEYSKAAISLWTQNAIVRTSGWLTYNSSLVGKAWFISGEYLKAFRAFKLAENQDPKNPLNYVDQARALGYLAAHSVLGEEKVEYTEAAVQSAKIALNMLDEQPLPIEVSNDDILQSIFELAEKEIQ